MSQGTSFAGVPEDAIKHRTASVMEQIKQENNMQFAKKTIQKMDEYVERGFGIIIGNNPFMDSFKKWANHDLILLARTNSRTHGYCIRTVWAIKQKPSVNDWFQRNNLWQLSQ